MPPTSTSQLDTAKPDTSQLDTAKPGNAKLGSAKLGSAKLGSAKLDAAKLDKAKRAQSGQGLPGAAWFAVVGYDGSAPAQAALAVATDLMRGRNGHLEVVYVAHLPVSATMSAPAVLGVREGFDVIAGELADTVRAALNDWKPRWHFQRRDGSVAAELIAAARELRRTNGSDSLVVIVVGSAEHRLHHVIGSTAASLTHEHEFPLLVVPPNTAAPRAAVNAEDPSGEHHPSSSLRDNDVLLERSSAEQVLARAGYSKHDIAEVLGSIDFPALRSVVTRRGQRFGISTGSLMERLGDSP